MTGESRRAALGMAALAACAAACAMVGGCDSDGGNIIVTDTAVGGAQGGADGSVGGSSGGTGGATGGAVGGTGGAVGGTGGEVGGTGGEVGGTGGQVGGTGGQVGGTGGDVGGSGGGTASVECGQLDPPAQGTCDVVAGDGHLLIRGIVLAPQGELLGGEVLVGPRGIIMCVDCDCSGTDGYAGATQITCADGVVSPGLINAHDHLTFTQNPPGNWGDERFEHRHDWRKGLRGHGRIRVSGGASGDEQAWGEMRQVLGGSTSLSGAGAAGGFLRNVDRGSEQEGLHQGIVDLDTFPLGDSDGEMETEGCGYPRLPDADVLDNDSWSPHVAEGIDPEAHNEFLCLSGGGNGAVNVTGSNGAFIHGVGLGAMDGQVLSDEQTAVIWSPRSNISLYGHTAPVTMLDTQGVLLGLGSDWTASGSLNIVREMACADQLNRDHYGGHFSDRTIWEMATVNNAVALAIEDGVGLLKAGLAADITIFAMGDAESPYRAIIDSNPGQTVLVLRSGEPLYGDSDVMANVPDGQNGCEPIPGDVCGVPKHICAQRETSRTFAQLEAANRDAYDLFFCDVPGNEPSCVPFRSVEFDGIVTDDDHDGDGVSNGDDNCPDIFNAVRPLDPGHQADEDDDGVGDFCDPCPLDPGTDECSPPSGCRDRDRDTICDLDDNCPMAQNDDQADQDADGKGDACDPCPADANPGPARCPAVPATIYAVKRGDVALETDVVVRGVVTAVLPDRNLFLQIPPGAEDYAGVDNSGIFAYMRDAPDGALPAVGDLVHLTGTVGNYFEQIQLADIQAYEVIESDHDLPPFEIVEPAAIGTDGERASVLEAALVRVESVTVTEVDPPAGPGDHDPTGELVVDDVLRIGDLFLQLQPPAAVGTTFRAVSGVLRFANEDSKLEPRDEADYDLGPPQILSISPPDTVIREGTEGVPTNPAGEPLTVHLTAPAGPEGQLVEINSEDSEILDADSVTVPAGERSAPISVRAHTSIRGVELTASIPERGSFVVEVRVVGPDDAPTMLTLEPQQIVVRPGEIGTLQVAIDLPAPAGFTVDLTVDNDLVEIPESVEIPVGAFAAEFSITAGDEMGDATVRATFGELLAQTHVVVGDSGAFVINEIDYDQPGGDGGEFLEIYNGTLAPIPLADLAIELFNGNTGDTYNTIDLAAAGPALAPGAFLVIGVPAVLVTLPDATLTIELPANGLQNGAPDGVRMVDTAAQQTLDGIAYEGVMNGVGEGNSAPADDGVGERALARCPDGADSDDNAADFSLRAPTPGAPNACGQ